MPKKSHLARRDAGVHSLLVYVDVFQDVNGLIEVAEQRVQTAKTDEREISQHLVERMDAELACNRLRITAVGEHLIEANSEIR